jgi:hypothetical protein
MMGDRHSLGGTRSGRLLAVTGACVAAAVIAVTAACAAGSSGRPAPATTDGLRIHGTWADHRTLLRAEEQLVSACMTAHGKAYQSATPPEHQPPTWDAFLQWQPIGPGDDVDKARREGYGPVPPGPTGGNDSYVNSLPPPDKTEWNRAMYGDDTEQVEVMALGGTFTRPSGGCYGDAQRRLYGELKPWYAAELTVDSFGGATGERVTEDPQYTSVQSSWSSCMVGKGYRFGSPVAAQSSVENAPQQQEIAVAVAAAECDRRVGYSTASRQLWDKYVRQMIHRYEAQLVDYQRIHSDAVGRARRITGTF